MIFDKVELGNRVQKLTQQETLWQGDKGTAKANQDTLLFPITQGSSQIGYLFQGDCTLILDAIVETRQGAVGKSIEKNLTEPFLMLARDLTLSTIDAEEKDVIRIGYKDKQEFLNKMNDVANELLTGRQIGSHYHSPSNQSRVFMFTNNGHKTAILVATGSNIVYKTKGFVFVANDDRIVLKSPEITTIATGKCHPTIHTHTC